MNLYEIYSREMKKDGLKTAFAIDYEEFSYKQFDAGASFISSLLSDFGIKEGDKVGFYMANRPFIVFGYFGCFKIGAVAVPASYYTSAGELEYEANKCGISIYFVSSEKYELVKSIKDKVPTLKKIVVVDEKKANGFSLEEEVKEAKGVEFSPVNVDENSPAIIFFTSGTTGRTKGVTHTVKSVFANAKARCETLRHCRDDVMLTTSYLCHGAAPLIALFPMLYAGGKSVFMGHYTEDEFLKMLDYHKVTHVAAGPAQWRELLEHHKLKKIPSLKYATTGGDVTSPEERKRVREILGIPLVSSLGMTECGGYMTIPPHIPFNDESVGMPIKGVNVKIADENYNALPVGEIGEILVKGDCVMCCYYNDEENTQKSFVDGWFKTGDLGMFDEKGYCYFAGRKKRIIIKGGGNINPLEVEEVLSSHPEIKVSVVLGAKSKIHGQVVYAFIVSNDKELKEADVIAFLKGKISDRKIPDYIEFLDNLPARDKVDLKFLQKKADQRVLNNEEKIRGKGKI